MRRANTDAMNGDIIQDCSIQSTRQQHNNCHRKQLQRVGQAEEEGKEEKGRGGGEKGRKGEEGRGQEWRRNEKIREAEEEDDKQVKRDVTDWTVVTRNWRQKRMTQFFVKVNESEAFPLHVSLDDKVNELRIGAHLTCGAALCF